MSHIFILSSRETFLNEFEDVVRNDTHYEPIKIIVRQQENCNKGDYSDPISLFRIVEQKIVRLSAEELRSSVCLIDEVIDPLELDPLSLTDDHNKFSAIMILAFPEIQFTFRNIYGLFHPNFHWFDWLCAARNINTASQNEKSNGDHDLKISSYSNCQLFDPYGIRKRIKLNEPKIGQARQMTSMSIEDEPAYAFFHGYTAYKAYHTCKLVMTFQHFASLEIETDFTEKYLLPRIKEGEQVLDLLYEDRSLAFYDRKNEPQKISNTLVDIEKRGDFYNEFLRIKCKNLISVTEENSATETSDYDGTVITKPGKGIYDLLKKSNNEQDKCNESAYKSFIRIKSDLMDSWAPGEKRDNIGHSAPGVALVIAESLLKRTDIILEQTHNVMDAIHAATLALEAKEILRTRTPTLSLKALALQHKAEITAESLFYGVEYNMDLKPRFKDLKNETEAISKWFTKEKQYRQQLNAYFNIVEHLAKEFTKWNQFDEEHECLKEAFKIQNRIKQTSIKDKSFKSLTYPLRFIYYRFSFFKYVEYCLSSIWNFAIAIIGVIFIFALGFYSMANFPCLATTFGIESLEGYCIILDGDLSCIDAFILSFESFFSLGISEDWHGGKINSSQIFLFFFTFETAIAVAHLSLFISLVYQKMSRR